MFIQPQPQASSCAETYPLRKRRSTDSRPNTAPAYYLGWPAGVWIGMTGEYRRRNASADLATGAR
jgi:hypothetical protein